MLFVGNRDFLLIRPRESFVKWLNSIDDDKVEPDYILSLKTLYMIDELEFNSEGQIETYLKNNFEPIFYNELYSWYTDESSFPALTFKNFKSFFDYEYIEMCFDTKESEIYLE